MTHLTHHIAGETLIYKVSLVVLYTIVAPHCGLVGQCHSLLFWTCPFRWNGNVTWDVFFSLKFYIYMVMEVKTKLSVGNVINIPYGFLIFIIKKQFQNHIKYQFNGMYRDNVHSSTNYTPQETETKCPHKRGGQLLAGCSSNQLCGMLEFRLKPCFGNNTAKNQCLQLVRFYYNFNIFCTWAY